MARKLTKGEFWIIAAAAVIFWGMCVMLAHSQTTNLRGPSDAGMLCQESPSDKHENAALTHLRKKLETGKGTRAWVQGVSLTGCNGQDEFLVLLYSDAPAFVLERIPKVYGGLPVRVKSWAKNPRID